MGTKENQPLRYSVIVLLEESVEDFAAYIKTLDDIFSATGDPFEILIMANGTEWFLKPELKRLARCNGRLKAFALNIRTSQAVCLKAGIKESRGEIIVACGAYQQITGESFRRLLEQMDDETDVISPWRQKRVDPPLNQFQSRLFNAIVRTFTGSHFNDLSCEVKIFRRSIMEEIQLYGNMYRFLPIVAAQRGFKCKEVKCAHHQERGKEGFYSLSEYVSRVIDILTLYFNTGFSRKPLRFFSTIGAVFVAVAVTILLFIFAQKLLLNTPIGNRAELLLALFFMVLGIQTASFGLLGEIITFTHSQGRPDYIVEKVI